MAGAAVETTQPHSRHHPAVHEQDLPHGAATLTLAGGLVTTIANAPGKSRGAHLR